MFSLVCLYAAGRGRMLRLSEIFHELRDVAGLSAVGAAVASRNPLSGLWIQQLARNRGAGS